MLLVGLYSQGMISNLLEEFQSDYPQLCPIGIFLSGQL